MIDPDDPIPKEVSALLADALRVESDALVPVDITHEYTWVTRHRLVMASNEAEEVAVVAMAGDGGARVLTGDSTLKGLSGVLVTELGSIPGGLSPRELSEAFRRLTQVHPMGRVGEPVLLQIGTFPQPGYLDDNLRAQNEAGRRFAAAPTLTDLGGGQFRLEFHYWTREGGVEFWRVEGTAKALTVAEGWDVAPVDSFCWPFA